jgi:uncharacterized protein (TIGR02391 family)
MNQPNYRLIAVKVGNALKWDATVNEVGRAASALFRFSKEEFPNESITSQRAKLVHDWILTLAKQQMNGDERNRLLAKFCQHIAPVKGRPEVDQILRDEGLLGGAMEDDADFSGRCFHPEVFKHSRKLFVQGNYFHAVFEAAKAYNKAVRDKSKSHRDGEALMLDVWGWDKGVLKVTRCESETDRNVQDGVKFLSAGLMRAIRNPTAHEPAIDWPITKEDALDILSFVSFLYRQLDKAAYFNT